jgi:hypothetical protein
MVKRKLHMITAYLDDDEYRQFKLQVLARGVGDSGYIREQVSFDVKPRGAPKGVPKKRKVGRPKKSASKRVGKPDKPLFKFE